MNSLFTLLDWDSNLFGFAVAKLNPTHLTELELTEQLALLREKGVKLCYWAAASTDAISSHAAECQQGFLADHKVTYSVELTKLAPLPAVVPSISSYTASTLHADLLELAYQSGLYSRFRNDPKITEQQFQAIYRTWIQNSIKRNIASDVLVIAEYDQLQGMVTLGEKQGRGDIGLLAVAANCRGRGYGLMLVQAAQAKFIEQGYQFAQVVTQKTNLAACALYEKAHFTIEKIENFYHFWLS